MIVLGISTPATLPLRDGGFTPGPGDAGVRGRRRARARLVRAVAAPSLLIAVLASAGTLYGRLAAIDAALPPAAPAVDLRAHVVDEAPIIVTLAARPDIPELLTTSHQLRTNVPLWRRMHLADWNAVPEPLRDAALTNMFVRYRGLLGDPGTWDRMTAGDWDVVPQPVRTVAYRHMLGYWAGYYRVGAAWQLHPGAVANTMAAVVMSESWFDHRGLLVNPDGTRDIGLGGASDFARRRIRELHARGAIEFALTDTEYEDPWKASRFVAVWLALMLDEAGGDLDRAIRAYHRGIGRADDELGHRYLAIVQSRLDRFIRNRDAPPAWNFVWTHARGLLHEDWPWLTPGRAATGGVAAEPIALLPSPRLQPGAPRGAFIPTSDDRGRAVRVGDPWR
jgi:hypothetical protein